MLVIFAVIGGSFLGNELQVTVIGPPAQVVGVCPSPAFIQADNCLQRVCHTGSDNQEVCAYQNAGYILGANQTRVVCSNNVCVATP